MSLKLPLTKGYRIDPRSTFDPILNKFYRPPLGFIEASFADEDENFYRGAVFSYPHMRFTKRWCEMVLSCLRRHYPNQEVLFHAVLAPPNGEYRAPIKLTAEWIWDDMMENRPLYDIYVASFDGMEDGEPKYSYGHAEMETQRVASAELVRYGNHAIHRLLMDEGFAQPFLLV